jgi:hypothetical protein
LNVPPNVVPKGLLRGLARELPNVEESKWLRERLREQLRVSENEPLSGQECEASNVSLKVWGNGPPNALESEQQRE